MSSKLRLGVLGSTRGTDLQAIIDAINNQQLTSTIEVVISNNKNAYILKRAQKFDIPHFYISHRDKSRIEFDGLLTAKLNEFDIDLILLIGFMRILSDKFCNEWKMRILNVHPSLLPKYAGGMDANVHKEVIDNGDSETGCTIHYVTADVDAGPILIQKKCMVDKNDTPQSIKKKVQQLEGKSFIEAIKIFQSELSK